MHQQLTIEHAIEAGNEAMGACLAKAEGLDPNFTDKACTAILAHLRIVGQCSGEVLTDVARAHGAVCPDDRAFGAVYRRLLTSHAIHIVGYGPRRKGHGCMGAKIYALVH